MKVEPVTPSDAAASPSHPDHARWVKERTLAIEVRHAQNLGLPARVGEAENARLLQRMDALARNERSAVAPPTRSRIIDPSKVEWEERRRAAAGVVRRKLKQRTVRDISPCGRCGTCRACMRERRVQVICKLALKQDVAATTLVTKLLGTISDANACRGRFEAMAQRDRDRAVERVTEDVCDATIPTMGEWR